MKKRFVPFLLLLVLVVSSVNVFGASPAGQFSLENFSLVDIHLASDDVVEAIAHMNINDVSAAEAELIVAARNIIIFGDQAWSASGETKIIRADGTLEAIPKFSDIFPADWELPRIADAEPFLSGAPVVAPFSNINFNGNVTLSAPPADTMTTPFFRFNATGSTVTAVAQTLPGTTYNLGLTNEDTGQCVDWIPNLLRNEGASASTRANTRYGWRASTGCTTGLARMRVTG